MNKQKIYKIVTLLKSQKGIDFSGYRPAVLERRINKRIDLTKSEDFDKYYEYLIQNSDELENLIDVLTLNVSHFFRNALMFEVLRKKIIPDILSRKEKNNENSIRIWSAGCSRGEEPYSVALIIKHILNTKNSNLQVKIFGTDIDEKSLEEAKAGNYKPYYLKNVKCDVLNKYFNANLGFYTLDDDIKNMVRFSFFDLVDKKTSFPSESIYGGFDIVFCRNVLIYFEPETQRVIFNKLYNALNTDGYLILGEAESLLEEFKSKFTRENQYSKIYIKNE